jgi:hypothetical protein
LTGAANFITGEALRFCARYAIDIIFPNGPGRAILFTESALEATDGEALRDVGPAIIRAQCAADPVQVAREIVKAKLAADARGFGPRLTERDFSTSARCEAKLASARSVGEIVVIEAKAASIYWRSHRDLGLFERKGGNLPGSWVRFANRGRGAEFSRQQTCLAPNFGDDQLLYRCRSRAISACACGVGSGAANRLLARGQTWAQFARLGLH